MRAIWRTGTSTRVRVAIAAVAQVAYPVTFAALYASFGDGVFSLAVIPVGLAAWAFGLGGGALSIVLQVTARALVVTVFGQGASRLPDLPDIALLVLAAVWFGFVRSLRIEAVRRAREAEALASASALLVEGTAAGETLHGILRAAMSVVPSTVASFIAPHDGGNGLRVVAILGAAPDWVGRTYSSLTGVSGRAWRSRSLVRVDDVSSDPDYVPWTPSTRSALAVPVVRAGDLRGLIYFEDTRPARFRERDVRLIRAFADQACIALESEQLERQMERLALYDTLTGLPNRN